MTKTFKALTIAAIFLASCLGANLNTSASVLTGFSEKEEQSNISEVHLSLKTLRNQKQPWAKRKQAAVKLKYFRLVRTPGAIEGLLKLLVNPDNKTRILAAYAFEGREAGPYADEDNSCRIDLYKLLSSKDPTVRISAVKAIGSFYKNSMTAGGIPRQTIYGEMARGQLRSALNDENPEVKNLAEETLSALELHAPTPLEQEIFLYDTGIKPPPTEETEK